MMKQLLFAFFSLSVLAFHTDLMAQNTKSSSNVIKTATLTASEEKMAKNVTTQMTQRYNLTALQVTKVQAINIQFVQEAKTLKTQYNNANTSGLRTIYKNAIKGVLTAVQYNDFIKDIENAEKGIATTATVAQPHKQQTTTTTTTTTTITKKDDKHDHHGKGHHGKGKGHEHGKGHHKHDHKHDHKGPKHDHKHDHKKHDKTTTTVTTTTTTTTVPTNKTTAKTTNNNVVVFDVFKLLGDK